MVIKIYAAAPSASSAVQYNERKVAEEKASVIFSSRIDDVHNPMQTFIVYENGSLRTQNMSFHASVNPGANEKLSDEQVASVVKEWMEKMGYGKQPYIVYKHTDTGRIHYHIVSVRVDENGKKISDSMERKRSQEAMRELSQKYGFAIGKGEGPAKAKDKTANPYQGFDSKAGDFAGQVERIADLAMTYYFRHPDQFDLIMESLGVKVVHREDNSCAFIGLDPKTHKPVTAPIEDSGIRYPTRDTIQQRVNSCKGLIKTREKQRVANAAKTALSPKKNIKTEEHTLRYLARWSIYTRFSKTAEGKIFGVSFVDHKNKCVFKASDLPGVTAAEFEKARAFIWSKKKVAEEKKAHHEAATRVKTVRPSSEQAKTAVICAEVAGIAVNTLLSAAYNPRKHEDEELMQEERKI